MSSLLVLTDAKKGGNFLVHVIVLCADVLVYGSKAKEGKVGG